MRHLSHILLSGLILLTLTPTHAEEARQSIGVIQQRVEHDLLAKIGKSALGEVSIQLGRVDPRLQLSACKTEQLETFLQNPNTRPEQARIVGIRCNGPQSWSIFLPVIIRIEANVVVAKQNLLRGSQLTEASIVMAKTDVTRLQSGYFQSKSDVINQVLKQTVASGQAITPMLIQSADVVRRGDTVQIKSKAGGLTVSMSGEALGSGGLGDVIHVRNLTSKRVLDGKIVAQFEVEVTP